MSGFYCRPQGKHAASPPRAFLPQNKPGLQYGVCHSLLPTGPGTCEKGQLTGTPVGTYEERAVYYQEKPNIQVWGGGRVLFFVFLRPALQNSTHESALPVRAHTSHSVHASPPAHSRPGASSHLILNHWTTSLLFEGWEAWLLFQDEKSLSLDTSQVSIKSTLPLWRLQAAV